MYFSRRRAPWVGLIPRSVAPGIRLIRLVLLTPRPVTPRRWLDRLPRVADFDTVIVTSRTAVEWGIRPCLRRLGPLPASVEVWAVGPGTVQALHRIGIRRVHRPRSLGAMDVAHAIGRGRPRRIVYLRSDRAGPRLAQTLREQGHRVADLIVYDLEGPLPLTTLARQQIASADLLVATSPSAMSNLRRQLGPQSFHRVSRTARLVVLGQRSRRAANGHGFRRVLVAHSTTAQRFTKQLLRELRDAPK